MFKRFMRSNVMTTILAALVAAYMVLVKYTTRWTSDCPDATQALKGNGKGFVALTWHSRFLMLNAAWQKHLQTPHVLISRSRDGEIVARASHILGLKTIRGSAKKASKTSSKGGIKAGHAINTALEAGGCIVITPDGPRGPRQVLQIGALRLARLSGAPIVTCMFAVKRRKVFGSWDKFVLPAPFNAGRMIWSEPYYIDAELNDTQMEQMRQTIENDMNSAFVRADADMGHAPILPADNSQHTAKS